MKIAVLVPSMDMVHATFARDLALAMANHAHTHPNDRVSLFFGVGTIERNRQNLARQALDWGADYTVWFDSDMRFPKDVIASLVKHGKDIVGCNYPTRFHPHEPTCYVDEDDQKGLLTKEDSTGLREITAFGFGCVAIKAEVFKSLAEPWFLIPWSKEFHDYDCGEDIYFCRRARDQGFKVYLDHDLSKKVAHCGMAQYTYRDMNGDLNLQ